MKLHHLLPLTVVLTAAILAPANAAPKKKAKVAEPVKEVKVHNDKGYYKDIFMDSGIMLNSRTDLPSTLYMGSMSRRPPTTTPTLSFPKRPA